jgi:hypothetical protein
MLRIAEFQVSQLKDSQKQLLNPFLLILREAEFIHRSKNLAVRLSFVYAIYCHAAALLKKVVAARIFA